MIYNQSLKEQTYLTEIQPSQEVELVTSNVYQGRQASNMPPTVYQGQASNMPPTVYQGQASNMPPTVYQGQASNMPPTVYQGQASNMPPTVYQGQASNMPLTVYQGQASNMPLTVYQGQASNMPPTVYQGQASNMPPPVYQEQISYMPQPVYQTTVVYTPKTYFGSISTDYENTDYENYEEQRYQKVSEEINDSRLTNIAFTTKYTIGNKNEYISSELDINKVKNLASGKSLLILSATGSGKTNAIAEICKMNVKHGKVMVLVNRSSCETQLIKDLLIKFDKLKDPKLDVSGIAHEALKIHPNLTVMTYQKFAYCRSLYEKKDYLFILDEVHALSEDSTYSNHCMRNVDFFIRNRKYTKRIYVTATPEYILPIICAIESCSDNCPFLSEEPSIHDLSKWRSNIEHLYIIPGNWDYLNFHYYDPNSIEKMCKYIAKEINKYKEKALIFINDINRGKKIKELLENNNCKCQHLYSDPELKNELNEIAITEKLKDEIDIVIVTKVAENGISIHDLNLKYIVIESYDPIVIQQVIGRARVNKLNPKSIEAFIPDYTKSNFGSILFDLSNQIDDYECAVGNSEWTLENKPENPYVYFDSIQNKVLSNKLALYTLNRQYKEIEYLKDKCDVESHVFVKKILVLYKKENSFDESMSISYDAFVKCHELLVAACENFANSKQEDDDLNVLKNDCKDALNTNGFKEKISSDNPQLKTLNSWFDEFKVDFQITKSTKVCEIHCGSGNKCINDEI